jgi:hypothetical protein
LGGVVNSSTTKRPPAYRHTQAGRLAAVLVASAAAAMAASAAAVVRDAGRGVPVGAVVASAVGVVALLAAAVVFSSLTVEVDATALRWHFAFGAVRRAVPRDAVARVEATATTLLDGVGIHRGPRGWVYNVAPGPAVRVVRRDGSALVLGTDDPDGLVAALASDRTSDLTPAPR